MKINIRNLREKDCACDALILPLIEGDFSVIDKTAPEIKSALKAVSAEEFSGKKNELFAVPAPAGIKPKKLMFVGLGKKETLTADSFRQAGGKALSALRKSGVKTVALSAALCKELSLSPALLAEGALLGLYTYDIYKTKKENTQIRELVILSAGSKKLEEEVRTAEELAAAVCFARDLVNAPSNAMTPTHMANHAFELKGPKVSVSVLEKADTEKLGMGAYLSVSKGSAEPPKFIVLDYKGAAGPPIVLVGKSVTFDSGGLSIKPSEGLEKMKYDMAGGAAVLGVIKAAAALKLQLRLIGILPATENLPGGHATRPGDIVSTHKGKTVEIINTDAEGRLTLADALEYAAGYSPRAVVDIATLTGACSIALGNEAVAMMGTDRTLIENLRQSAEFTNEKVWEMPLYDEYLEYLKSDTADIKNVGGRTGSLVTSARFLKEFAGDMPWVHLDIASTAWTEKDLPYVPKGASGIGVRLLFDLIRRMA